jgi:hypothetical protein
MAMFDDPLEMVRVIAAHDDMDDVIIFNPDHEAWADMRSSLRARPRFFSTLHPYHIVRLELGHAAHYRTLNPEERMRIWHADLNPEERESARRVSWPSDVERQGIHRRGPRWPLGEGGV